MSKLLRLIQAYVSITQLAFRVESCLVLRTALEMNEENSDATSTSQWLFPRSALLATPSASVSSIPLEKELYDRARGVEFLFRLGGTLQLSV